MFQVMCYTVIYGMTHCCHRSHQSRSSHSQSTPIADHWGDWWHLEHQCLSMCSIWMDVEVCELTLRIGPLRESNCCATSEPCYYQHELSDEWHDILRRALSPRLQPPQHESVMRCFMCAESPGMINDSCVLTVCLYFWMRKEPSM